ncbi:competence protein ComEA [Virgibacillus indicus]|uniref:Competence protein ComEA n=1 Tax=Virgibacillus indicus TaxID=2024554 RepID=A0A265NEM5_9BACI|nr:helix-hairpin-helix domain-containing protein [Virgibacillus indicus]OZU89909.1 competence protein ComEA [Virgibacillus indicus]
MLHQLKKYSFFIVIGIGIVVFFFLTKEKNTEQANAEFSPVDENPLELNGTEQNSADQNNLKAIVDVKGEVMKPGVYEMEMDARVNDVIQTAGGFSEDADQSQVNLAQKVQDEMIIIIPKAGESDQGLNANPPGSEKVRINYASQQEIESLSGIGPSKAAAIIQHRDEYGFFRTLEDLLEVSGIGEKTLETLKDDIQVP